MSHPFARQIARIADANTDMITYDVETLESLLDAVINTTKERCIQALLTTNMGDILEPEAELIRTLVIK